MSRAAAVLERLRHAEAWAASGMTQREYCRQHAMKVSTLNRWVLAVRRGQRMVPRGESLGAASRVPVGPMSFREVTPPLSGSGSAASVRITLPSGMVVELPATVDAASVAALVRALEASC